MLKEVVQDFVVTGGADSLKLAPGHMHLDHACLHSLPQLVGRRASAVDVEGQSIHYIF